MSERERQLQQEDFADAIQLIREARTRVYRYANQQLVTLYWEFGRFVSRKVREAGWGKSVVEQLAAYIQREEPGVRGFSDKNIWRMKQFHETYRDDEKLATLVREIGWTHNLTILARCKTVQEREFYLRRSLRENYSKRELERQISSSLYERSSAEKKKLSPAVR